MHFLAYLFLFTAFLASFIAINLIWHKRGNRNANRFLGILLIVNSLWIASYSYLHSGLYRELPHLMFVWLGLPFLLGPLSFFYTRSSLEGGYRFKSKDLVHLLPLLVALLYYAPVYFWNGNSKISWADKAFSMDGQSIEPLVDSLFHLFYIVHGFLCVYWSNRLLKTNRQTSTPQTEFSTLRISSLSKFNGLMTGYWSLSLLYVLFLLVFNSSLIQAGLILTLARSIVIYLLLLTLLSRPELYTKAFLKTIGSKYAKSTINPEKLEKYRIQLEQSMVKERLFLKADLSALMLSKHLNIPTHALSQTINEGFEMNFYDFINQYRIEEVKKRLVDKQFNYLTITGIGESVGFGSKSSFQRAFKKHLSMTPSEYISLKEMRTE